MCSAYIYIYIERVYTYKYPIYVYKSYIRNLDALGELDYYIICYNVQYMNKNDEVEKL